MWNEPPNAAPRVLLTRRLPPLATQRLRQAGLLPDQIDDDAPPARDLLLRRCAGCSAILSTFSERIDAELLDAAGPSLRVVANFAVGFDNIDVAACTARGVRATNTPGVLSEATADLTWALILATARNVTAGDRWSRSGTWPGWTPNQLLGLEMNGATLGILGPGGIGRAVARRATGFGMRLIYCGTSRSAEFETTLGAARVTLDELLEKSDVLSIHIPMRAEHRHLIGAAQLARMKPGAILVNTSRGAIIDEAALLAALRAGRPAAAGLDVYEHEPRITPGLAQLDNVVLLPHLGSGTHVTRDRMAELAVRNIVAVLRGEPPPAPLN